MSLTQETDSPSAARELPRGILPHFPSRDEAVIADMLERQARERPEPFAIFRRRRHGPIRRQRPRRGSWLTR